MDIDKPCNDLKMALNKYGRHVQSLAFVYLKNRFDAEDAAQEVFIKYLNKAPWFISAKKEKSWLMTVTVNQCKTMLRAKYREDLPLPEDLNYLPPQENDLMLAVLGLDEKYRLPIHLHYYEGYSLAEIAKLLQTTSGTVASWLSRGREKLKEELREDYFDE